MAKRTLNVEIGSLVSKVLLTEVKGNRPVIHAAFYFPTPEHTVEDGYILDREAVASRLKQELTSRGISEKRVVFTLASSKIINREVTIPQVKPKKIWDIISQQASDYFPVEVDNYNLAYTTMGSVVEDNIKKLKLQVIAIPNNLIPNYRTMAELAGLRVDDFNYVGFGTLRLMRDHTPGQAILVQLEERSTIISFLSDNQLMMQRITPYGFSIALQEVLSVPQWQCETAYQAYTLMREHNLIHTDATTVLYDSLSYQVRMVKSAIEYYQTQTGTEFDGTVYLQGDGARFLGIAGIFASLGYEVAYSDVASAVQISPAAAKKPDMVVEDDELISFATLLGSAIETIKLQPIEEEGEAAQAAKVKDAFVFFTVCATIAILLVAVGGTRYLVARMNNTTLNEQIDSLSYLEEIYAANSEASDALAAVKILDEATLNDNEQLLALINDMEKVLPTDILVNSIQASSNGVTFNMTAESRESIAQLIINMKELPELSNVAVPSIAESENESGMTVWTYSMTVTYATYNTSTEEE